MRTSPPTRPERRTDLLHEIERLARVAIFGSASETFRTCGNPGCRCHGPGPKHGPHMYVSFRGDGKTSGYYVPADAQADIRAGIAAWHTLQLALRELAGINSERVLARARERKSTP